MPKSIFKKKNRIEHVKKYKLMKRILFSILILSLAIVSCNSKKLQMGEVAIIPQPNEQIIGKGHFEFKKNTVVSVENEEQQKIANNFLNRFEFVAGWKPEVSIGKKGDIRFITDNDLEKEAYVLNVSENGIQIRANSNAGFFYAIQSLKQLMPINYYSKEKQMDIRWAIPVVKIKDSPAFQWRGYMLDVSRHFFDVEQVKKVIDFMSELKLNRFHWHLADDQGWRIEIKSYPKLTEIGAWRMDYNVTDETISNWFGRPVQKPGEKPTYGGFYTQEQIKEIVSYAKERYIEVIPEIDMPGHAQATIAAYPEIGCVNAAPYVATGGVVKNNTYNPGKEETFEFADKMLNEVMDLFPFEYVHIGGDECNKSQWKEDPYAQKRIRDEGLKDAHELQSYFIKRIEKIINKRGKKMIGWDEILEGGLAPNATVMSWRGEAGGIKSAKAGHDVIMTPSKYCYIDLKQGHDDLEPNLGYSQLLLSKSYGYQVIPDELSEEEGKHILGIQANMWTESISDWGKLTYMSLPRTYAIAETGWTDQSVKDWDGFVNRLYVQMKRLDQQNVRYAVSAFSPWIDHIAKENGIEVSFKTEANHLDIHYSLDGSEPTSASKKYEAPFIIEKSAKIKAQSFRDGIPVGTVSELDFPVHLAAGSVVKSIHDSDEKEYAKLTDLNYGKLYKGDKNWQEFDEDMEVEILLEEPTTIKEVSMNFLRFTISGVYIPSKVEIFGAMDDQEYQKLGEVLLKEESLEQGRNKIKANIEFDSIQVNKIKIIAPVVNPIPEGHHRAGEKGKLMVDEIVVF